jgi:hypothetical protein
VSVRSKPCVSTVLCGPQTALIVSGTDVYHLLCLIYIQQRNKVPIQQRLGGRPAGGRGKQKPLLYRYFSDSYDSCCFDSYDSYSCFLMQ